MLDDDPEALAAEFAGELGRLESPGVEALRAVRKEWTARMRDESGAEVLAVALALVPQHRWVAYELVYHHGGASAALDAEIVERLGEGMASWVDVDTFGRYISGPAWQADLIDDSLVTGWAESSDRWWRRAALVSTVPLNLRAAGGTGDTPRTLAVCEALVHDRDDMVVKALSWALRQLSQWDPDAVRDFLARHGEDVAARVRREVRHKLETGRKHKAQGKRSPA
ncbi:MAG: DNA alkylation repair protein [Acidimicrobiales bacterium]|nr:DNA alkylation repair protein [Acidimicrobiales bacterium]